MKSFLCFSILIINFIACLSYTDHFNGYKNEDDKYDRLMKLLRSKVSQLKESEAENKRNKPIPVAFKKDKPEDSEENLKAIEEQYVDPDSKKMEIIESFQVLNDHKKFKPNHIHPEESKHVKAEAMDKHILTHAQKVQLNMESENSNENDINSGGISKRGFATGRLWTKKTVPYEIDSSLDKKEEECKKTAKGSEYKGMISTTISNRTCQMWKLNTPHRHRFNNLNAKNYCRNPDGEPAPWCYTTDPKKRWEICNVPFCNKKEEECKKTAKGSEYKGMISTTISNRTCQMWKLNTPHRHRFNNLNAKNYCRNPDGEPAPWCYTTDPKKRWEICNVPFCNKKEEECKKTAKGSEYKGMISTTISNRTCQMWKLDTPHRHRFNNLNAKNYCRNPDGEPAPWCYTTDPKKRWEICNVPFCNKKEEECKKTAKGSEYKGMISTTISNRTCQMWKLNTPHRHRFNNLNAKNYCRNPDGEPAPWCYTTDPKKRWEICNVPFCS